MRIRDAIAPLRALPRSLLVRQREIDATKVLLGQVLGELHAQSPRRARLQDYEYRVFSQWGEDGILQHLTRSLPFAHRTFIEFGVEDFSESNCRFLLEKDNWKGYVLDGRESNISRLRSFPLYWRHSLEARAAFITRDNVAELLAASGFDRDLGILSVDVDGVDFHLLEVLGGWHPRVVVVEYNAVFGGERAVSVPYQPDFDRFAHHFSGLYQGASLPAFVTLLEPRGYRLVGVNSAGNNAFFVRDDLLTDDVPAVETADVFTDSAFRESRDEAGDLTYVDGPARRALIADLPLVDVLSGKRLRVGDLDQAG